MRKLFSVTLICLIALVLIIGAPYVDAHAESTPLTLTLGDGASIPFLDGFQSNLIADAQSIAGVTGAIDLTFDEYDTTVTLQNIALTDDVLALFYKQTSQTPFVYEGDIQFLYNWKARPVYTWIEAYDDSLVNSFYRECRPLDEHTRLCMVAYTLQQPIPDGTALVFGKKWSEEQDAYTGGMRVMIDRSRIADPTVVYTSTKERHVSMTPYADEKPVEYTFIVERVAFTPFGNRCLINYRATSERNASMGYRITNAQGKPFIMIPCMTYGRSDASEEHPVWVRNESWFFGGTPGEPISIVPTAYAGNGQAINFATTSTDIASLPADVQTADGCTIRIERCDVLADGFYVTYAPYDYEGHLNFDLADENGESLKLNFTGYSENVDDIPHGLLGFGASWSEAYKGKTVARVTAEQRGQVKRLLIGYYTDACVPMTDQAIRMPQE